MSRRKGSPRSLIEGAALARDTESTRSSAPKASEGYRRFFGTTFGPVIALREILGSEPERLASFDREFREFTIRQNHGSPGAAAEYPYKYLLVVARKRTR